MGKRIISLTFVMITLAIVGIAGYTAWEYYKTVSDIYDLREDTVKQRENILNLTINENNINKLELEAEAIKTQLNYNTTDGVYFSKLLDKIEKSSLKLIKFQAGNTEESEGILANSIAVEIEGNYKNIINIFKYLENSEALIQIQNVEIASLYKTGDTETTTYENKEVFNSDVSARFTLVIYSINK